MTRPYLETLEGKLFAAAVAERNEKFELLSLLRRVRDSFLIVEDHGQAVMSEADNHHFDEICAAIAKAEVRS